MTKPKTQRTCRSKKVHASQAGALAQLAWMLSRGSCRLQVYRCPHCHQWHVRRTPRYRGQR